MFGRMMNSYYYGKSGKGDFTPDDLPKNRWELFWAMLRVRLSALVRLNLMTIVAFLPYFLVILINVMNLLTGWSNAVAYQEALASGAEITEEIASPAMQTVYARFMTDGVFQLGQYAQELVQNCLWMTVRFLIPAILITGPVEAGLAYVCRNWARDEHAFIWSDFKDAVKDNWKQGLAISAITSVFPAIIYVCYLFYGNMAEQRVIFMIPQVLVIMIGFIWSLSLIYFYPLMVSYKLTFSQLFKNGLILSVGRLPQSVGLKLLSLTMPIICAVLLLFTGVGLYAILVIGLFYLLIGVSLNRFIYASYTNAIFDKFINSKIEGVRINRGMSVETDDDEGEEDTEPASEE